MTTNILMSVFYFIVALALLIAIHEFGHYWVAKRLGVKVLRFSIGFGSPLLTWRGGADQTEYVIAAVPLGGYVKMLDEREGEVAEQDLPRAFNRQLLWKRSAIVVAGPLFNFILAIIVYWFIYMAGVEGIKPIIGKVSEGSPAAHAGLMPDETIVAVDGKTIKTWDEVIVVILDKALSHESINVSVQHDGITRERRIDLSTVSAKLDRGNLFDIIGFRQARPVIPPVISYVQVGGAAQQAGLEAGDKILRIDGLDISDWEAWVEHVRTRPHQAINLEIERQGKIISLIVTPGEKQVGDKVIGYVGAETKLPDNYASEFKTILRYAPLPALWIALKKTWDMSALTLHMLGKMITGDVSMSNISGPISIAQYAGYSASAGIIVFLSFLAVVSISLGVLNLLPIPVLDGGHLLFYLAEFVKGAPLSERAQLLGQRIGIVMLLILMVIAFYNDIVRLVE